MRSNTTAALTPHETPVGSGPHPKLHSIPETARLLGIGQATVFTLLRIGRLRKVKIFGRTLIAVAEIDRFLAELETEAAS